MASTTTDRAAKGSRPVAKAFLDALAGYPEDRQKAIARAALAQIRETFAAKRAKAKAKKASGRKTAARKAPAKRKYTRRSFTHNTETAHAIAA